MAEYYAVQDTFVRTGATSGLGATTLGGRTWVDIGSWHRPLKIVSTKGGFAAVQHSDYALPANGAMAVVDLGWANFEAKSVVTDYAGGSAVVFRAVNATNHWRARTSWDEATDAYSVVLEKVVNGTITAVGSASLGSTLPRALRVRAKDDQISVWYNTTAVDEATDVAPSDATDVLVGTYTDATFSTTTRHGIGVIGPSDSGKAEGYQALSRASFWFGLTPVGNPSYAPDLVTPLDGVILNRNLTQRFTWVFKDPDPQDSQQGYVFRYRVAETPDWTTISADSPNSFWDAAAATFADNTDYEWQVATTGIGGQGPFSTSRFFTAEQPPPGPSITSPINNSAVPAEQLVEWTSSEQEAFELRRVADNAGTPDETTIYETTGIVEEPDTREHLFIFDTNRYEHLQLRVRSAGLWSGWTSIRVDVSFDPPPAPVVTLTADQGWLIVSIQNPAPVGSQVSAAYNEIHVDDGHGLERRAVEVPLNDHWVYWTPVSGRDYAEHLKVVAIGSNGTPAWSA